MCPKRGLANLCNTPLPLPGRRDAGSGKTFTMEGYRYVSAPAPGPGQKSPAGTGAAAAKSQAAAAAGGPPRADFEATPVSELGITPRALYDLFGLAAKDTERRYTIR
jgi:hypothetical protein